MSDNTFVPFNELNASEADYICLYRRYKQCCRVAHLLRVTTSMNRAKPSRVNRENELLALAGWARAYREYQDAGGRLLFTDF